MKVLLRDWPPSVRRRVARGGSLLLLLDFDGTLSPLSPTPRSARMGPGLRRLLRRLNGHPRMHVGIISGRAVADVKKRVGVPALFYGGNHGLELKGPGIHFQHPGAFLLRPVLDKVEVLCRAAFDGFPGVLVEAKGLGVAVHDRRLPRSFESRFNGALSRVKAATRALPLAWQPGHRVWEALPRVAWDKGRAARLLRKHLRGPLTIAIGDDKTDENLFRAVNRGGVSIRVAPEGPSAAQYAVPGQGDVAVILKTLDDVIRREGL